VIEAGDLLTALNGLPEGAELLQDAGVTTPPTQRPAPPTERDWTQIDAGQQVLAAAVGAQRRASEENRSTVSLDDLLLTLASEQATLLSRSGWEVRALLQRRRQQPGSG
jgi:hypothetical protein